MEKKSNNNSVRHVGSNVTRRNTTNKNVKGKKKHPRLKKVIIIFAIINFLHSTLYTYSHNILFEQWNLISNT